MRVVVALLLVFALALVLWLTRDSASLRTASPRPLPAATGAPAAAPPDHQEEPREPEGSWTRVPTASEAAASLEKPQFPRSRLAGRVVHADQGVPDARVEVAYAEQLEVNEPLATATTDSSGHFRLPCPGTGPFRVSVTGRVGDLTLWHAVDAVPAGSEDLRLVLVNRMEPDRTVWARVQGRVLDSRNEPRAGAMVIVDAQREGAASTRSDASGDFELRLTAGPVRLRAFHPGAGPSDPVQLVLAADETRTGVVFRLGPPGQIEGRVLGLGSRPVVGRFVTFEPLPADAVTLRPPEVATDAQGRFRTEAPPGRWRVRIDLSAEEIFAALREADAAHEPRQMTLVEEVDVRPGETSEVWFALSRAPVRLRGVLTKAGEPTNGGELRGHSPFDDMSFQARVEGSAYVLALPFPGPYELTLNFGVLSRRFHLVVHGEPEGELDLDIPVGWIEGTVQDEFGEPVSEAQVATSSPRHGDRFQAGSARARTEADGTFRIEAPPGVYGLVAEELGSFSRRATGETRRDVVVAAGQTTRDVRIRLYRGASLLVSLEDELGRAQRSGSVELRREGNGLDLLAAGELEGGLAHFAGLQPGSYQLRARAPGHVQLERCEVELAQNEVRRLGVPLLAGKEVVVSFPEGTHVRHLDAVDTVGRVFGAEEQAGSLRFAALPPGAYLLRAFRGETVAEEPLSVDGEAPGRIEFSFPLR